MTAFSSLITVQSLSTILARGLAIATGLGLPVTTWRPGDPTRSLYHFLADVLATREGYTTEFIKAAVLSTATGDWLTVVASEVYGVTRVEATYASSTLVLTNGGGGYYTIEPGDITVKSAVSGKTYHNTTGGTLAPSTTLSLTVEADEAGTDSSAAEDEIDTLVTTLLGVTVTSSTAAVATDEQENESLREQCRATLGALSPNGPPDAYEYVARNPDLTGTTLVTKAATVENSSTGLVVVFVAGPSGGVGATPIAAVQAAIETWATPLCITPTVVSASAVMVAITATITGGDLPATFDDDAEDALLALIGALDIGDDVSRSAIIACLHDLAVAQGGTGVSVLLTAPAADVTISAAQVAAAGTITLTVVT